jgi:hypothetical protein
LRQRLIASSSFLPLIKETKRKNFDLFCMHQVQGALASDEWKGLGVNTGEELVIVNITLEDTEKLGNYINFYNRRNCLTNHTFIN